MMNSLSLDLLNQVIHSIFKDKWSKADIQTKCTQCFIGVDIFASNYNIHLLICCFMQQSPAGYLLCPILFQVLNTDNLPHTLTGHSLSVHSFSCHQCGTAEIHSQAQTVLRYTLTSCGWVPVILGVMLNIKIGFPEPPKPTYQQRTLSL